MIYPKKGDAAKAVPCQNIRSQNISLHVHLNAKCVTKLINRMPDEAFLREMGPMHSYVKSTNPPPSHTHTNIYTYTQTLSGLLKIGQHNLSGINMSL